MDRPLLLINLDLRVVRSTNDFSITAKPLKAVYQTVFLLRTTRYKFTDVSDV